MQIAIVSALAIVLAGCTSSGSRSPEPAAAAVPPPDPIIAGVVAGSLGLQLSAEDRQIAGTAQFSAIKAGARKSWKGKGATFGFITTGPQSAGVSGACREYSHTIYMNGRPQTGKGSACETAPGRWTLT